MPSQTRSWEYEDVAKFLERHGFALHKRLSGSHEFWLKGDSVIVDVNRPHGGDRVYRQSTLKIMISQSGYDSDHWQTYSNLGKKEKKVPSCCLKED